MDVSVGRPRFEIFSMDSEQGSSARGSIPRLSRLPVMPRASHDNLRSGGHATSGDNLRPSNVSSLPRPSEGQHARTATPKPLAESVNRSIKSRYGWGSHPLPALSNHSVIAQESLSIDSQTLDTTPPSSTVVLPTYGDTIHAAADQDVVVDENATLKAEVPREKRRPRPSLSERTAETLSRLSPSPSPVRRRSSILSIDGTMGPPYKPASAMNPSRAVPPLSSRSPSPTKKSFRPPGSYSPTKEAPLLPSMPLPSSIYTPPKAHMRGNSTHIGRPPKFSSISKQNSHHASAHLSLATAPKSSQKTMTNLPRTTRIGGDRTLSTKPSLSTIFKDPPKPTNPHSKLDLSSLNTQSCLMKPKTRGENTLAPSPSSSPLRLRPKTETTSISPATTPMVDGPGRASKSSAALRETIAKAKAGALRKVVSPSSPLAGECVDGVATFSESNNGLLRKRVQAAVTSGMLNISAMGLKQIPDEVMKMYDFDQSSSTNWAEAVDMVKLMAADNDLCELRADSFPDWSAEDLDADDAKSNQFAGLEVLDLHRNMLQEVPMGLRRLQRLQTLNLSNNKLSIDALEVICQISNLKELYLADNKLSGRLVEKICQLANLEVLDLHSNLLEDLPRTISDLESLKRLNLSENKLTRLPVELLPGKSLIELNVSKNRLSGTLFPSSGGPLERLRTLDVSYNALESISEEPTLSLSGLVTLAVDSNRLSKFPSLSALSGLTTLTASENLLTEIPDGFTSLHGLQNVNLSNNVIKSVLEEVGRMEALVCLNLSGNPLRERKYLNMQTQDLKLDLAKRFSSGAPAEQDLPGGHLIPDSSSAELPKLAAPVLHQPQNGVLELSSQSLPSIDPSAVDLTSAVHTINLSANSLTVFPSSLLMHPMIRYSLHTLDLSHNPLLATEYLAESCSLPKLRTLNLVSTGLNSLDALTTHLSAPELIELNISCHRLSGHVPWVRAWWPSVRTLLATDNWFSSIDVEAVRGLEVLDVRNNEIEALPPKMGMLGVNPLPGKGREKEGRLRTFECSGNRFRVPRWDVVERGTEAVMRDLRRMVPAGELEAEWLED